MHSSAHDEDLVSKSKGGMARVQRAANRKREKLKLSAPGRESKSQGKLDGCVSFYAAHIEKLISNAVCERKHFAVVVARFKKSTAQKHTDARRRCADALQRKCLLPDAKKARRLHRQKRYNYLGDEAGLRATTGKREEGSSGCLAGRWVCERRNTPLLQARSRRRKLLSNSPHMSTTRASEKQAG